MPEDGPLGGIRDGLEATSVDLCYVTSTDAPFISAAFVQKMLSFGTTAAPVVDGFIQTLAASPGIAIAVRVREAYGTVEADEIAEADRGEGRA